MSKAKDFYSKSVTEAIRQACADFATSQEKLDIEVVETGSKGIFGLCKKRAHIRVTLKKNIESEEHLEAPVRRERKKKPVKARDRKPARTTAVSREPEQIEREEKKPETIAEKEKGAAPDSGREETVEIGQEVLASIKNDLEQILSLMGFSSEVTATIEGQSIQCNIKSDQEENIVGQEGRVLDSLQYLIRKIAGTRLPDKIMVDLDVGNYREERMQQLKEMALDLASQVKESGKTMSIPALNPSERRVVHVVLQDDKKVRSRSVGDGVFKKILIFKPGTKNRKSGPRRRGRQGGGASKQ